MDIIVNFREEADRIIGFIDRNDASFIATALCFNCPIWSDDKHFLEQNEIEVFTTKMMIERFFN